MSEPRTDHEIVRASFAAYRVGLLDAGSAQELRVHLRGCADCRAAFGPFAERSSEEEDGRTGHVPLALLATWDQAALPAVERALLAAHLEGCARCSDGLQFSRRMRMAPPRGRWRRRIGLAAGGATALVATLLVMMRDTPKRPAPQWERMPDGPAPGLIEAPAVPGTPVRAAAPAPARPRPVRRADPVQLGHVTRGGHAQVVRVSAGTTALPLRVPPLLGVGPEARIRIDVRGPGGARFGHADLQHKQLYGETPPPALEASAPDGSPLPAGRYDVRAVSDAPDPTTPGGFQSAEYGFELQFLTEPAGNP